jgi:broad specificity phosphatase PhoE
LIYKRGAQVYPELNTLIHVYIGAFPLTVFYLARHGYANYELADKQRLKGAFRDFIPLTSFGCNQIKQASQQLNKLQAEIIISSPMTRALQSAAILSHLLDLPLEVEFDLHEWIPDLTFTYNQSILPRVAYAEMMSLNGEWPKNEYRDWEPLSSVRQRVLDVLKRYCNLNHVIVVCHGVIISSLTGQEIDTGDYLPYLLGNLGDISQQED